MDSTVDAGYFTGLIYLRIGYCHCDISRIEITIKRPVAEDHQELNLKIIYFSAEYTYSKFA